MKQNSNVQNEEQSAELFKNKYLNALSRTHILVPISMVAGFSAWLLYRADTLTSLSTTHMAGLFFAGLLLFTFAEYMIHRKLYHLEPNSKARARFTYIVHGVHHDHPRDTSRIAMPPVGIIIYLLVFYALFRLLLGDYSYATLSGFGIGYCLYISVHYAVHTYQPPNNFLRALWTNHAIHHYKDDTVLFGVSSPLWDYILGTVPKEKHKRVSVEVKAK